MFQGCTTFVRSLHNTLQYSTKIQVKTRKDKAKIVKNVKSEDNYYFKNCVTTVGMNVWYLFDTNIPGIRL